MAVAAPTTPFIWGAGGSMKTPEQIAREREIAAALLQGGADYSPVDHWLQGAARAAQAGVGALKGRWADEAENEGRAGFQSRWDSVFGGAGPAQVASIDPVAEALTATDAVNAVGATPSGMPATPDAAMIRQGLIERGLPEHVADAFIMNFQDESALNPGINEASPIVPGSRGGFGLAQWTGPRRVALENYASSIGANVSDPNVQLDFLMSELQGPEAGAAKAILSAPDTGTAAAAIVNEFLRPAEEHRARRAASYMGGAPQMAQANTPDIAALLGLASDPWANDTQRSIINSLVGQQIEQQAQANDPLRQLQIERAMLENDALRNPAAPKPIEVGGVLLDPVTFEPIFDSRRDGGSGLINAGDGNIYDPSTGQWITAPGNNQPEMTDTQRNLSWRAEQAGLVPGTPEYAEFMRSGGQGGGMALSVGPDGTVQFTQGGAGGKPLTEAQSKDTVYATRAAGALPLIDQYGPELTNPLPRMVEGDPTGLARGAIQSPDFQRAQQAGKEFLQAILRKDTGAAITPQETAEYGTVYLPMPGDSPELIEQKRISRQRALAAIEAGMPPQAILQQEQALRTVGEQSQPSGMPAIPTPGVVEDGYRFKGGDPADPNNWEKVQ